MTDTFHTLWARGALVARTAIAILLLWPVVLIATASALTPAHAIIIVPIVTICCLFTVLLGSNLAIIELGFARYVARVIVPYLLIGLCFCPPCIGTCFSIQIPRV